MSKKALFVWGGWDGHTPKQSTDVFAAELKSEGYDVEISDTLDVYLDADKMKSLDLIVQTWTMGEITEEQSKALRDTIAAGCGLAGFHGGIIDSFRNDVNYQWMTGGQWVSHPGGIIPSHDITIVDKDHPITKGIGDFVIPESEQYYVHTDAANHVLATTTFTGKHGETQLYQAGAVIPYAWTRQWGKGKVFVACWGHTDKDFDVPQAKEITKRGLLWASK